MPNFRGWDVNELEDALSDAFGMEVEAEKVVKAPTGHNDETHDVAHTDRGRIGLKLCSQGQAEGEKMEDVVTSVATDLEMPNAEPAEIIEPREGFPSRDKASFDEEAFLATVWLDGAEELGDCKAQAQENATEFLEQYGMWAVFSTAFGVTDRSDDNLVWVEGAADLAQIDFESAFKKSPASYHEEIFKENLQLAETYGQLNSSEWESGKDELLGPALADGIRRADRLLKENVDQITEFLEDAGIDEEDIEGCRQWIELATEEKIELAQRLS